MRLYVNGVLAASARKRVARRGSGATYIGRLGQSYYPFQGTLDEVAVSPWRSPPSGCARITRAAADLRLSTTATAAAASAPPAQATANGRSGHEQQHAQSGQHRQRGARRSRAFRSGRTEPAAIGDTLTYQYALTNNGPPRQQCHAPGDAGRRAQRGCRDGEQGSCSTQGRP